MKNTLELDRALKKQPKTLEELALLLGGGFVNQKAVMRFHANKTISIKSINIDTRLIASLMLIVSAQIFPFAIIRSGLSLLVLMIIPYYWSNNLLLKFDINSNLTIGLVITELMFGGLLLGYLGLLDRNIIFIGLLISLLSKYALLKFKN